MTPATTRAPRDRTSKTPIEMRWKIAHRRALLESLGKCINGPAVGNVGWRGVVHGPPVKGGKCAHCLKVSGR